MEDQSDCNESLDIVLVQSILFAEDVLVPLGAEGGGFVSQIEANNGAWPDWSVIDPVLVNKVRGFEAGGLLRILGSSMKFECALCERVHNHQTAADLGLDSFWRDPQLPEVRLIERSYSLLATDFGQFVVVFCFRFEGGSSEQQADAVVRLCAHRAIRKNIDQREYAKLALQYANDEINRRIRILTGEFSGVGNLIAPPTWHERTGWITYEEDLTAFPWILAGALSPRVVEIMSAENNTAGLNYHKATNGNPCLIFGTNYAIFCEVGETRPMRLEIMPVLIHKQCSYYTTRQIQKILINQINSSYHINKNNYNNLRTSSKLFDRFSIYFGRVMLAYSHFNSSQIPRLGWIIKQTAWYVNLENEHNKLRDSISQYRDYLRSCKDDRAHRDAKRQEVVLFSIAVLQILSLIGVLSDYKNLNPDFATETMRSNFSNEFAPELWLLNYSPWILRGLFALIALICLWYCSPAIGQWVQRQRNRLVSRRPPLQTSFSGTKDVDRSRFLVKPSQVHGVGLWTKRCFDEGEILFDILGGQRITIQSDSELNEEYWEAEWNARPGTLHVRISGTQYRFINHSRSPNAQVTYDSDGDIFSISALRNLEKGEEILLDYRKEPLPQIYIIKRGGYL